VNALLNRDTGSDQVQIFGETQNAFSSEDVPLEILSPKQAEAMRRLGEIAKLPENWDSYGSPPPTSIAVDIVMDLLLKIDDRNLPSARVVPVSSGGVQLEWRVPHRELQLEISGEGIAQYLQIENGQPIKEEEITPLTNERVKVLLMWLISRAASRWAA
jgi:hypothetical protein